MEVLVTFILFYLLTTTTVLLINRSEFTPLLPPDRMEPSGDLPLVSLCVPARNESRSIKRCVDSLLDQTYPNLEIWVLDDRSTDGTTEILNHLAAQRPADLHVIHGDPKPDGWLGKPWACHQLSRSAGGSILLFADADTVLEKDTVSRVVASLQQENLDMLTVWPKQQLGTFWEKTVVPLVYHALLTLLPARYVYRDPRWLPRPLRKTFAPMFAAACGQFIAFRSHCYQVIGGHSSVQSRVVEDVELARLVKRAGFRMKMYHGEASISCRMYTDGRELEMGFRKNFLAGFNYRVPLFVMMGLLHLLVFIVPLIGAPIYLAGGQYLLGGGFAAALLLIFFQRFLLAIWFNWNSWYGLLHPLGVLWFIKLAVVSLIDYYWQRTVQWKDRPIR
ncbi:MAG: glycosyltransferase [Balneolaceae bacterium]|nr:glycosyltransferase [Balneolaceae bacterium]